MSDWQHGFYRLDPQRRRMRLIHALQMPSTVAETLADHASDLGNELVENYLTDYGLPEGLGLNLTVNGRKYAVPMVVEEPSVIAAASNGAMRVQASGGFTAPRQQRELIGQVVLTDVSNIPATVKRLTAQRDHLLAVANAAHPSMQRRGGGAQSLTIRTPGDFISVDLGINVCQAMGANSVNTMAEAVAHELSRQGYQVLVAILSNLATNSLQTVSCDVDFAHLATRQMAGDQVARRIAQLSQLAQVDPYRAATHNKGIMNGIDAVMIASDNDWRAIESGAHAYAARDGQYRGLSSWTIRKGRLHGELTLPMPVGVVGGSIGLNPLTKLNYRISRIQTAEELAAVATSLGLAQNLAALRALATTGIQAGHMKLQYRSLAVSVGATAGEVPLVVAKLAECPHVDRQTAQRVLAKIRKDKQ